MAYQSRQMAGPPREVSYQQMAGPAYPAHQVNYPPSEIQQPAHPPREMQAPTYPPREMQAPAYLPREMPPPAYLPREMQATAYPPREMQAQAYLPREMNYSQQPNTYPSPNPSQRSQRTERSQSQKSVHSRASMRSTNGIPDMESRSLEASHILDQLRKEIVFLTGGRDRKGGPLLIFPPHRNEYFEPSDFTACLKYLFQIPSEESKRRGFTAIIDSRDGSWSNLVTVLGCLKQSLGDYLGTVLVLKTESLGPRQASSSSFRRDRGPNLKPEFVNLERLNTFVDRNQLMASMGGTLMYHHTYWLQNRLDLEKFLREARAVATHLDTSESEIGFQLRNQGPDSPISPIEALHQHRFFQDSILSVPNQVLRQGQDLLQKLQQYSDVLMRGEESVTTLDNLEAQKQVKQMLQYIESRVDKISAYLEDRDRSLNIDVQRDTVQREKRQVVDWILGPGEKLLASQSDIGDSFEAAEALRKRHEELEIKCTKDEDIVFETFYHGSGKEFQCIYQNGMRFYLDDWGSKEWQVFPKRWYNEGRLVTNTLLGKDKDEKNNDQDAEGPHGSGDDREGFIMHPTKGRVPNYIFYKKHNVHMYFDRDTGSWVRMPIAWELHHDTVKSLVDKVEEAVPTWGDRQDILALLRACNYDPDECIAVYLHLQKDEWMQENKKKSNTCELLQEKKDEVQVAKGVKDMKVTGTDSVPGRKLSEMTQSDSVQGKKSSSTSNATKELRPKFLDEPKIDVSVKSENLSNQQEVPLTYKKNSHK